MFDNLKVFGLIVKTRSKIGSEKLFQKQLKVAIVAEKQLKELEKETEAIAATR